MVLWGRLLFDKRMMKEIAFHSIQLETKKCGYLLSVGWSKKKGDWWKSRDEDAAKFFSAEWLNPSDEYIRTGIYIGRLALVYQTRRLRPKGTDTTE